MGSTYIAREGDSQYCDRMGRISFAALLFCISQEKGENVDLSTVPNQTKTLICESLESIDKDILSTFNVDIDMKALCQNNSSSRVSLPSLLTMSVFLFLCSRLTAIQ